MLDLVREVRPPFNPSEVVAEFCEVLRSYRATRVHGDKYAGDWPSEAFARYAVAYEPCGTAKSDIYRNSLPLINTGKLQLLDVPRLVSQALRTTSAAPRAAAATASITLPRATTTSATRRWALWCCSAAPPAPTPRD